MTYYIPTSSPVEKFYNTFIRERWLYHVFPRLVRRHYALLYGAMRPFFAREFPWFCVRPGQTVIQVGSAKMLIPIGRSHALILATLVGPSGRVIVVEPDPANAAALRAYCAREGVRQVTVIERAAWKERGSLSFSVRPRMTGWHRITDTVAEQDALRYRTEITTLTVEADTIDHLIAELHLGSVAFVNMTINGGEPDAFAGMQETIARDVVIAFPVQNARTMHSSILAALEARTYTVFLKHAPVATHQQQFIVAAAMRHPPAALLARSIPVRYEATEKDDRDFLRIIPQHTNEPAYDAWTFRKQIRWF